ncbi:protein ABHD18-like [Argonauta hians]
MSRLDQWYRRFLISRLFTKGWGKPENLKKLFDCRKVISNRDECMKLVPPDYPVHIDKDIEQDDHRILEGHFLSPFAVYMSDVMPKEVEIAKFQMILPKLWKSHLKPVCVQLGGTGDHFYWRRRTLLGKPLLKEFGIASIILENPYYGVRKPKQQLRSALHNVSDLFVMGGALILESIVLLNWCEQQGWGPLGITGISMGGHMASLAASNWNKPLSLIPCLSWSTASGVFTHGVLSEAIPWRVLQSQYLEESQYGTEIKKMIHSPEDVVKAFNRGKTHVDDMDESLKNVLNFYRNQHKPSLLNLKLDFDHKEDSMSFSEEEENKMVDFNSRNTTISLQNTRPASDSIRAEILTTTLSKPPKTDWKSQYLSLSYAAAKSHISRSKTTKEKKISTKGVSEDALNFMRDVMEEFTHLGNYSQPVDTSLIIIVAAKQDAYIPHEGVLSLKQLWPEAEVRYIDSGHISAFLFNQKTFRMAIKDAFDKQIQKYYT